MVDYLTKLANVLDSAERFGGAKDSPEGTKYIKMSDTLAKDISKKLKHIAKEIGEPK